MSERWVTATVLACSAVVLLVAAQLALDLGPLALGAVATCSVVATAVLSTSRLALPSVVASWALGVLGDARSRGVSVDGSGG